MFYILRRTLDRRLAKTLYSIDRRKLRDALAHVGLGKGMTVVVHSQLSQLGYVAGGPP